MTDILILYYSSYGHTSAMADAVAEGVRRENAAAEILRVPETAPPETVEAAGFRQDLPHDVVDDPERLAEFDGIIVGSPTRYGRLSSQMAAFWDRTGPLWKRGALVGKVGATFTSTATQHGGQELTQFSLMTNLFHMGMTVVGLDYGFQGQMELDAIHGGSPYGASTVAGADGSREPTTVDLDGARYLGARVARVAAAVAQSE